MSVRARAQLAATVRPHCSPGEPGFGLRSASGQQSGGTSPAVSHHHCPNQPSPLARAPGRGPGQPPLAPQRQTPAVAALGQRAVAPSGLGSHVPIQRRSTAGVTLAQGLGDRLGGPCGRPWRGRWRGGMLHADSRDGKAAAQCGRMLLPTEASRAWPPAAPASISAGRPGETLPGRKAGSGAVLPGAHPARRSPAMPLQPGAAGPGLAPSPLPPPWPAAAPRPRPLPAVQRSKNNTGLRGERPRLQMLGNNAAVRKGDVPARLSAAVVGLGPLPVPVPSVPAVAVPPGCYATPAGELPRLTYTLFILTLVARAFVIFNEKLALHHRGEGVCQPSPLPKAVLRLLVPVKFPGVLRLPGTPLCSRAPSSRARPELPRAAPQRTGTAHAARGMLQA